MRLDMYSKDNETESTSHAFYDSFSLEGTNYTLKLGNFNGSDPQLSDNLMQFNNRPFDAKNTKSDTGCAHDMKGGWWYASTKNCIAEDEQTPGAVMTRPYNDLGWYDTSLADSIGYRMFEKYEMKIRPSNCKSAKTESTKKS